MAPLMRNSAYVLNLQFFSGSYFSIASIRPMTPVLCRSSRSMWEGRRTAMRFTMYRIRGACSSTICSFTDAGTSLFRSLASRSMISMAFPSPSIAIVSHPRAGPLPAGCIRAAPKEHGMCQRVVGRRPRRRQRGVATLRTVATTERNSASCERFSIRVAASRRESVRGGVELPQAAAGRAPSVRIPAGERQEKFAIELRAAPGRRLRAQRRAARAPSS